MQKKHLTNQHSFMITTLNKYGYRGYNMCGYIYLCIYIYVPQHNKDFSCGGGSKESTYNVGNQGSIPGLGGSPGEGNGNPLQYSCLGNPMGGGAW